MKGAGPQQKTSRPATSTAEQSQQKRLRSMPARLGPAAGLADGRPPPPSAASRRARRRRCRRARCGRGDRPARGRNAGNGYRRWLPDVEEGPRHREHRRDAAAARDQQQPVRFARGKVKSPAGPTAFKRCRRPWKLVQQPARADAVTLRLHRDAARVAAGSASEESV